MQNKIDHFSLLLRDLEAEIGTRDVAELFFNAFIGSINSFKVENFEEFLLAFEELMKILCCTEPRFGILNYHFENLKCIFSKLKFKKGVSSNWKKRIIKEVKNVIKDIRNHSSELLMYAEKLDVEGKTILIHDHSHTVQDVLCHYKSMGKKFRVVIAEQDFDKTHDNIERLYNAKIPFQVVPSYMLSHIHDRIDMLFFGSLTLKNTMNFVMSPGTHGVISEFHFAKIPIYLFIDTDKFSLWNSKKRGDIFIYEHKRQHHRKQIEYERIKYSHDRVPAQLFTKIITNEGIFDFEGIKKLYIAKLNKGC